MYLKCLHLIKNSFDNYLNNVSLVITVDPFFTSPRNSCISATFQFTIESIKKGKQNQIMDEFYTN